MNTLTYRRTSDGRMVVERQGVDHCIHHIPNVEGIQRTNYRVTYAFEQGANTDRVVDMLRIGEEVRAIYRAALICSGRTPYAYFDAWPQSRALPRLDEQTRRGPRPALLRELGHSNVADEWKRR